MDSKKASLLRLLIITSGLAIAMLYSLMVCLSYTEDNARQEKVCLIYLRV